MNTITEAERDQKVKKAGLAVIGPETNAQIPDPEQAWKAVSNLEIRPSATIAEDADDALEQVNQEWLTHAHDKKIINPDGSFLVSISAPGSFRLPWARVQLSPSIRLAQELTAFPGQPEFVAMATDGSAACGVTSEEDEYWVVCSILGE
ncbi:hypothetical protein FHX42_000637 [Saccharopolyspora lacisalsi]|uniref:Uncharacterized protein n=1 Tax=Halosaccharopolyspora lacisalsi TaxID=1000566 RepID=A0A839DX41_9PSEU|nr:hypothetical protein [Halosaccharopolyspora lacisalsi]MBA8823308.1 hypothetical protein [Halosaccharopolyspora lacisalsi]